MRFELPMGVGEDAAALDSEAAGADWGDSVKGVSKFSGTWFRGTPYIHSGQPPSQVYWLQCLLNIR
jgi:hypothetical protein